MLLPRPRRADCLTLPSPPRLRGAVPDPRAPALGDRTGTSNIPANSALDQRHLPPRLRVCAGIPPADHTCIPTLVSVLCVHPVCSAPVPILARPPVAAPPAFLLRSPSPRQFRLMLHCTPPSPHSISLPFPRSLLC